MTLPVIVAVAGDPGGANALIPVLQDLKASYQIKAFVYLQAERLWEKLGIPLHGIREGFTNKEAEKELIESQALGLISATSLNEFNFERNFVAAANKLGINSVAVLDFWSNYRSRFYDDDQEKLILPRHIAVMDERAKEEMHKEGFQASILEVTGQPALEEVLKWKATFRLKDREELRKRVGISSKDETLIIFASQPLTKMLHSDESAADYRGYTEKTVLPKLLKTLNRLSAEGNKLVLAIKPHPRENFSWFKKTGDELFKILVVEDIPARELIMAADLVTGMNSILLVESCLLARLTLSLQPGLKQVDVLPVNKHGISIPIYHDEDMYTNLAKAVQKQNVDLRDKTTQLAKENAGATAKIISLFDTKSK